MAKTSYYIAPAVKLRIQLEKKIVNRLIDKMIMAGWVVTQVDNGDGWEKVFSKENALKNIFDVDQAHVLFSQYASGKLINNHWVFLVFGNDGWDCISDYSYTEEDADGFAKIVEEVSEEFNPDNIEV